MPERVFSKYKLILKEALENREINKNNIAFVEKYLEDSLKIEEKVIKTISPRVKELYSAIERFTGLKSAPVTQLISDPKNLDECFERVIKELEPNYFEVDANRRILREKLVSYLKHSQITLLELIAMIEMMQLYMNYIKEENLKLKNKLDAQKKRLKGVKVG